MSRLAIVFLVIVPLGLAILLSLLGWISLSSSWPGWFLSIAVIVYWIRGALFGLRG